MPSPSKPQLAVRPPPPVTACDLDRFAATGEVALGPGPAGQASATESRPIPLRLEGASEQTVSARPIADSSEHHRTGLVLSRHAPLRRRTTFYLSPETARRCVLLSAEFDTQMSDIAEEALRRYFAQIDSRV
jgi:hypothetical protein